MALQIVSNKLSPSSRLSILSGNFIPKNVEAVNKYRVEALKEASEENNNSNNLTNTFASPVLTLQKDDEKIKCLPRHCNPFFRL